MTDQPGKGDLAYLIMHPVRRKIIGKLRHSGPGSMYISQLADEMKLSHGLVSYHLTKLSQQGLVEDKLELGKTKDGNYKAIRSYHTTSKLEKEIKKICNELELSSESGN